MHETDITWDQVNDFMTDVRAMAQRLLRRERNAQSLQTTALVLTALRRQKLAEQRWDEVRWDDREAFLAAVYRAMDRALKDHGRRRMAKKRRHIAVPIEALSNEDLRRTADFQPHDLAERLIDHPQLIEALTAALNALERHRPRWAAVARHRYYGGLTIDQTARLMDVSERTVRRQWEQARVLLHDEIVRLLTR